MAKRIGLGFVLLLVAAGGFAAWKRDAITVRYTEYRFRTADTDEARAEWAGKLADLGESASPYLAEPFRAGDEPACAAVIAAVQTRLADVPPDDPRCSAILRPLLEAQPSFAATGSEAALSLVPLFLKCPDADAVPKCRDLVRAGLKAPNATGRVRAVGLALSPRLGLKTEAAPLLDDPDAAVRLAAMLAVGPNTGDGPPAVDDETLFKWLHDPDAEVRELCASALRSRGLEDDLIALAEKLTSPDPADRLRLLLDLRSAGETVRDPGPWLERLGRDPDPAVRAGAVRVGFESRLVFAGWADQLADADPDPTVRRLAGYYRGLSAAVKQAGAEEGR
jgi:hypothetical protein